MVWAKCSDDYALGCIELTDAEYRTLHETLLWVMAREVGPRFAKRDLRRFAETADPDTAMDGLVRKGFILEHPTEFEVIYHMHHQPEPDVIAKRKDLSNDRQRRYRRKKAGLTTRDETRDVTRKTMRDPGRDGTGREDALREEPQDDTKTGDWPPLARVPGGAA